MSKTVGINFNTPPAMRGMPDVFCLFPAAMPSRFAVINPVGADAAVTLKFNNRGSAPLDIETARIRNDQPVEGGMVSAELHTSGGMLLAKKGLTQTSGGVMAAMLDSTLPGDGEIGKELTYYAAIPAGSSFLFAPVMLPVPAAVPGKLLLSASVTRPAFNLASAAVAGLGSFQVLLEESSVSSAPYTVSVAADQQIYDQNTPVTLSGEARGTGGLLASTSVQVEVSGRGYPRTLAGFTNTEGHYAIVFNPMPGEAGMYTLAAFPPEAVNHAIQSTFTIIGLAWEPLAYSGTMSQNSTLDLSAALKNTGGKVL